MELAIIKTGGKQYKVAPGQKIEIEKLAGKEGDQVVFDDVLLTVNGDQVRVGKPGLKAKVTGKILKQDRADKVIVFKYKAKKRYQVKRGHRQPLSLVEIEAIKR